MLNDIDDCKTQLNFHLSSSLSSHYLKTSTTNLSCANSQQLPATTTNPQNDQSSDEKNVLISLLPSSNSAGKLSWKFFEQVDSLDNQLRSDESSPPLLNGGLFLSSNTTDNTVISTNDVGFQVNTMNAPSVPANPHSIITDQTLPQGCNRKSNGYAIHTTEILSQTYKTTTTAGAADLNTRPAIQQQQQKTDTTFVFTSPTSTFKRKKQQQLLKEEQEVEQHRLQQQQQQQQLYNNNLYKFGNGQERPIGTTESATTFKTEQKNTKETTTTTITTSPAFTRDSKGSNSIQRLRQQYHNHNQHQHQHHHHHNRQQQQQQQQQRTNKTNETKTVINNSLGAVITDTVAYATPTSSLAGSGSTNRTDKPNVNGTTQHLIFKAHTLPAITKTATNTTFITDGVVDLVDTTTTTTKTSKALRKSVPSRKRRHKMQASSSGGSGSGNTTTAKGNSTSSLMDDIEMHLGLLGWRKKCLYTLLVLLMLLIIVNLGLTLWILKVMEFSTEGMGQLKIVPGGIQLTGQALVMDMLRASTIRSRHGQPISIESSRNFSINTRDTNGMLENHLFLGHDKLECLATGFRINDTNGRNLFSVNRNEVTIGAHALRIDGEGGAIFRESIQTPHVRAEPGRELRLESPTRQLEMTAAKDINLQSRAGGIEISALEDVKLTAIDGSLRFESSKIFMPNLRTVQLPLPGTPQNREHLHRVFQLCACANGKLFLAAPHSVCAGDDSTVCR